MPSLKVFKTHNSPLELNETADAIPAGSQRTGPVSRYRDQLIPVSDLIGTDLPSQGVVDFLFKRYLESVHWFMMVFYQPSLQAEMNEIVSSGVVPRRRISFLLLVLLILSMGAKYASHNDIEKHIPMAELNDLQAKFLIAVEERFLDIFNEGEIEAVQIAILLSSYYLYHRQPKKGFAIIGAGVKSAQAMGLHQESSWGQISHITREVRRRNWWALVVADGSVQVSL